MIVAAAQFQPTTDRALNLATIAALVGDAVREGAGLVVLPEYAAWFRPGLSPEVTSQGEVPGGAFARAVQSLCDDHGVAIVAGMLEAPGGEDPRPYNAVAAFLPGAGAAATYRKMHLYDAYGAKESDHLRPGALSQRAVFRYGAFSLGLQTCFDLRFPEVSRLLVDDGADTLVVPAQWAPGPHKREHWETLIRARAIENLCYVIAAGQGPPHGVGHSMIVDPTGEVLARVEGDAGIAVADISPAVLEGCRATNPALSLRRFGTTAR